MEQAQPPSCDHTQPIVGVAIVGHNDREWLPGCLDTVTEGADAHIRVVFIDNASQDESADIVQRGWPNVDVIRLRRNVGFAGGSNIAIRHLNDQGCEYFFLLNPDARCPSRLLSGLVDFCRRHPEFGAVGPLEVNDLESADELNEWTSRAISTGDAPYFARWLPRLVTSPTSNEEGGGVIEHSYIHGAAFFVHRDVLLRCGLFDETFETFYEDVDLSRRIRWAGYRIALLSDFRVEHRGRDLDDNSWYRVYHKTRNRYYLTMTEPTLSTLERTMVIARIARQDFDTVLHNGKGGRWKTAFTLLASLVWHCAKLRVVYFQLEWRRRQVRNAYFIPPKSIPGLK